MRRTYPPRNGSPIWTNSKQRQIESQLLLGLIIGAAYGIVRVIVWLWKLVF